MANIDQDYKSDLLNLLKVKGSTAVAAETGDEGVAAEGVSKVSFYKLGDFVDLCRGPHVSHSGKTGVFKLHNVTSAYWRNKAENDALQRLYGYCYHTAEELAQEEKRQEEIKEADHRTIGQRQKLFFFAPKEIGPGLSLWLPNGTVIRKELEALSMYEERKDGYLTVVTPELAKESIYERSRHLPYYAGDMYNPIEIEKEKYRLRPMNCPHHHMVYLHEARSYRDLPLRIAEHGKVFRYEASGALTGLLRTRGFTQNDAHVYVRYDQAKEIFIEIMNLHARYYKLFGLKDYYMRLSMPDVSKNEKYVDNPGKWQHALDIIRQAMKELDIPVKEVPGEAAFYGPKIDVQVTNALGNEYTISTNQVDFLAAETFNLTYHGEDGKQHPVFVLHRTPLGSHERFIAFLSEHYKGAFPTWLAPVQCKIVCVSDKFLPYAQKVKDFLFQAEVETATKGLRVSVDTSDNTMNNKVRIAQAEKVPYILVVGQKEMDNGTVSVRTRDNKTKVYPLDEFLQRIKYEVENRLDYSREEIDPSKKARPRNFAEFLAAPRATPPASAKPSAPSPAYEPAKSFGK